MMEDGIQQYYHLAWRDVDEMTRRRIIEETVEEMMRDMMQQVTDSDREYLCKRISQNMRMKYSGWRVMDFRRAMELGKIGEFGMERKLSVANAEKWLYKMKSVVAFEADNEGRREQQRKAAATADMMHNSKAKDPAYPEAVLWRLSKRTYKMLPAGMSRAQYLKILNDIPYFDIVAAIKAGNEDELLSKHLK